MSLQVCWASLQRGFACAQPLRQAQSSCEWAAQGRALRADFLRSRRRSASFGCAPALPFLGDVSFPLPRQLPSLLPLPHPCVPVPVPTPRVSASGTTSHGSSVSPRPHQAEAVRHPSHSPVDVRGLLIRGKSSEVTDRLPGCLLPPHAPWGHPRARARLPRWSRRREPSRTRQVSELPLPQSGGGAESRCPQGDAHSDAGVQVAREGASGSIIDSTRSSERCVLLRRTVPVTAMQEGTLGEERGTGAPRCSRGTPAVGARCHAQGLGFPRCRTAEGPRV